MKTNEIIRLANKRDKEKQPLYYGTHKGQEYIVYEKAVVFYVKKGTIKQLKETTTHKKRIVKLDKLSKSMIALLETKLDSEDMVAAEITDTRKTTKHGIEAIMLKAENDERWIDSRFLSYFSPKRKAYFDISGWKNGVVFITETNILVGVICIIANMEK